MTTSLVTFGDIDIQCEPIYSQDGRAIHRTLLIGPIDVRVHLNTIPDKALTVRDIMQINFLDYRDPFPYALEMQERLTEDEAQKIISVLDSIEKRVRERLGVPE